MDDPTNGQPSGGLFAGLGNMLGGQAGQPTDPRRMMLAQALMGGNQGPPANSLAGGLSQGLNPMMRMLMMQKMQQQPPGMAPNADMGGPASTPYMLGGTPQQ